MKKIDSFCVDHTKIVPGIYLSRIDYVNDCAVVTYDIRICFPNKEFMEPKAMHTIEHIVATYLRNEEQWKDRIIYWGPMGCETGFYLIMAGEDKWESIYNLIYDAFKFTADFEGEIPGTSEIECGNCRFHDLSDAKAVAKLWIERMADIPQTFNYGN